MASTSYVTPELFRFFRQLERNNDREWFQKNKKRYEAVVRDPLLELVSDFAPRLHKISPHLVADPRPVGGALFRIYRDVRFSKDKTPYKTAAGVRFPHEDNKSVHAPGFYLHLEPGYVFAAAGVWHPEAATLQRIRDKIVADPKGFTRSINGNAFKAQCELGGESLKRPPKGYDPDHPLIEHLKRKDFIASTRVSQKDITSDHFMADFTSNCKRATPFMRFLCEAVGVPF